MKVNYWRVFGILTIAVVLLLLPRYRDSGIRDYFMETGLLSFPESPNTTGQFIRECDCHRPFFWPRRTFRQLQSSCQDEATHYHPHQNVISFALPVTQQGMRFLPALVEAIMANLNASRTVYPGYALRIYTNLRLSTRNPFCRVVCNHSEVHWCNIHETPNSYANNRSLISKMVPSTWDILPLGDPTVDVLLSRNVHAVVSPREAAAVQDWLQLKPPRAFHVLRDTAEMQFPIREGLWGAQNREVENVGRLRERMITIAGKEHLVNEAFLTALVFLPRAKEVVVYDSYNCDSIKRKKDPKVLWRPFPVQRENPKNRTVTDVVGIPRFIGWNAEYFPQCPEDCRPADGRHWKYC